MAVDHEGICDCSFKGQCGAFADPLVPDERKSAEGLGCLMQTDVYRNEHCRTFRCAYLCAVLTDGLERSAQPSPQSAK